MMFRPSAVYRIRRERHLPITVGDGTYRNRGDRQGETDAPPLCKSGGRETII